MNRLETLSERTAEAITYAPALAARLEGANLTPADLTRPGALNRLPVLSKTDLMTQQADQPPFAGYLGVPPEEVQHIYASPGPIFEPVLKGHGAHGFDRMFAAAGLGPGDIALNTWSYHLVPAGLVFDEGVRSTGATVVPAGPGQTDFQVRLIRQLGVTAFLGSTAYFEKMAALYAGTFGGTHGRWTLKRAFLGGEPGDWMAKRRLLEEAHGITTYGCYGTADLGLVGYEDQGPGYRCHKDRLVQICDGVTGEPLSAGQQGQVVVTTLSRGWPMIRFGTGDLSRALAFGADGFVTRMSGIEGRVGDGVKVREIFLYASHAETLAAELGEGVSAEILVSRENGEDRVSIELAGPRHSDAAVHAAFRKVTRLRPDHIRWHDSLPRSKPLEDTREF